MMTIGYFGTKKGSDLMEIHLKEEDFSTFGKKLSERNDIAAHKAKRLMRRKRRWEDR